MNDSASDTIKVDIARLPLLLRELRLPTIASMWQGFTERGRSRRLAGGTVARRPHRVGARRT